MRSESIPADSDSVVDVRAGVGEAHAKAILFGEHAVVYGAPALALPLSAIRTRAEILPETGRGQLTSTLYDGPLALAPLALAAVRDALRAAARRFGLGEDRSLRIESDITPGRGLGSSAAVAAAIVAAAENAAGIRLDAGERHGLIQIAETTAHGTSSGLDAHAVVSDRPVWFQGGRASTAVAGADFTFVVADSGEAASTRVAVADVRRLRTAHPSMIDRIIDELGVTAERGVYAFADGDLARVGTLMEEAHALLGRLGVSAAVPDLLVRVARAAGALGAKITGGGRGGCIIALASGRQAAMSIGEQLSAAGARSVWTTRIAAA